MKNQLKKKKDQTMQIPLSIYTQSDKAISRFEWVR